MGHNNDGGMLILTQMKQYLARHNIKALGDGGYGYYLIVSPDANKSKEWNNQQKGLRSVIETVCGMAKCWDFAANKVRVNSELQMVLLNIIYNFVAQIMEEYPLRVAL